MRLSNRLLKKVSNIQENDQQVVERVLRGDKKAFGAIIAMTERLVTQIIFKMVRSAEDRKDIVQEVYLKTFKNLSNFKFQAKLSTWIGHIAYNTSLNYLKRKKQAIICTVDAETNMEEAVAKLAQKNLDPYTNEIEQHLFNKELGISLAAELDRLPPLYKTLITLFHHEDLSCTEISDITGLPEGTVKNYLFRARKMLRNSLLITNYVERQ